MNIAARLVAAVLAAALAAAAAADETQLRLKEAPEATLVRASCSGCHSVDYIQMNSPFMNRAAWEAEVRKMIKVMGAPVRDEDVGSIVAYLTHHYGVE
jgi:cytochrome c5